MKRLLLALCLATVAAAAQAESLDHRHSRSSRHDSSLKQSPSPVSALLKWLTTKAKPSDTRAVQHHATRHRSEPVEAAAARARPAETDTMATAPVAAPPAVRRHATRRHSAPVEAAPAAAPTRPAVTDTAATAPVAALPALADAAVTDAAVAAPAAMPEAPPDPAAAMMPHRVATLTVRPPVPQAANKVTNHGCADGQRIISAFYWEGTHTASGARFDPAGMTAAHRTLPFGTRLVVTNPRNGKSVTVTINDRGPFVKGVTLDLSRGAAKLIGMQGTGAVCMAKV